MFIILGGGVFFIGSNLYITSLNQNLIKHADLILHQQREIENLTYIFESIKANMLALSATTKGLQKRQNIQDDIYQTIQKVKIKLEQIEPILNEKKVSALGIKEKFSQEYLEILDYIPPLLERLQEETLSLCGLLQLRDNLFDKKDKELYQIALQIRDYNSEIPDKIEYINKIVFKSATALHVNYDLFQEQANEKKSFHFKAQVFIYLLAFILILLLLNRISRQIVSLYEKIENRLYTDELTSLGSRYAFMYSLEDTKKPIVVLVDIDKFRSINELFGVKTGNEVLQKLASLMREFCKKSGCEAYRLSADEFALLKEANDEVKNAHLIALNFYEYYKKNYLYIDAISDTIELEFTFGIAAGKEQTLAKADMALEYAKANDLMYKVYSQEIDTTKSLKDNILWKKEIKEAVIEDNFVPFFQPIYDREAKIFKYEALARLKKLEAGKISYIPPVKFLDIAVKTKYYAHISKMVIFKSLDMAKEKNVQMSINISKKDILNSEFLKELKEKIKTLGIGNQITFEITESEDISHHRYLKNFIVEFRDIGVKFAIDDFGSGFSNFSFILEVSPDFIKIDGSLIKNIDSSKNSYELVKSIVAFSHALDKKVVAEFVHSKEVFDIAYELGIDLFQGYYFAQPALEI
jgi:diguanylate cyclase (GGDEF)-like protein